MNHQNPTRRNWLKATGLGIGSLLAAGSAARWSGTAGAAPATTAPAAAANGNGILRVAHITDVHVQPELRGGEGMADCLRHIHARNDKPDFILNTGDCVMDSLRTDLARTRVQWDLWKNILRDECALPIRHGLGNHDIWGWKKEGRITGTEPLWGKAMGLEMLELERAYYSFDHGAWHFIVLDSIFPIAPDNWHARLDDQQFEWLADDLKATDPARPVLIASHCPLFSPSAIIRTGAEDPALPGRLTSTGTGTHLDIARIGHLFDRHPNVKLCISGHLHQSDRAEFRGVTYITNPAVSANKWKGRSAGRWEESYTMLNLHPDGQFNIDYVDFNWTPQA